MFLGKMELIEKKKPSLKNIKGNLNKLKEEVLKDVDIQFPWYCD